MPRTEREQLARDLRAVWAALKETPAYRTYAERCYAAAQFLDDEQTAIDRFLVRPPDTND